MSNKLEKPGEREGAVIPLNLLRGYTNPLALVLTTASLGVIIMV